MVRMPAGAAERSFYPIDDALCFPGAGIDPDADSDTDPKEWDSSTAQTAGEVIKP
jgi:hypothetical protein